MTTALRSSISRERLLGLLGCVAIVAAIFGMVPDTFAHGVTEGDKGFIQESTGILPVAFVYLGAKHMMTGYDRV